MPVVITEKTPVIRCFFNKDAICGPECFMFPAALARTAFENADGPWSQEKADEFAKFNNVQKQGCRDHLSHRPPSDSSTQS